MHYLLLSPSSTSAPQGPSGTVGCGETRDGCLRGSFDDGTPAFFWLPDVCDTCECTGKVCNTNTEFTCVDRSDCIQSSYQCDGEEDCADGSDEEDCQTAEEKVAECTRGQATFSPQFDRCTCPSGSTGCSKGNACFRTIGSDGQQVYYWQLGSCGTSGFDCACEVPADATVPADQCRTEEATVLVQGFENAFDTIPANFGKFGYGDAGVANPTHPSIR